MKLAVISFVALTALLSCGRNEILSTQENARHDMREEIVGTWSTPCEGARTRKIEIKEETMTFEFTSYLDAECQEKVRTVAHSGAYKLSHNYKAGINNSIILVPAQEVAVTLHTETDVEAQNNVLIAVRNETESTIPVEGAAFIKKTTLRNNEKLRQAKSLGNWARDQSKPLNRLQLEKLNEKGLNVGTVAEQGSRIAIRYELDNGFLQIGSSLLDTSYRTGANFSLNGIFAK